ncbi:MAG TPA: NAD-dependent epimerase/dehydratase family protein [Myxococcales bacterium]|nr:NAD-dependent epimerase/dehydratase family protein [Myxococcales bacterium]
MRALVTGASGFIGGAVARALLRRGAHVRVLLRAGTAPNGPALADVEIARGDLRDAQAVSAAVRGCDAIFHVGALYSFTAPLSEARAVNVGGTRNVIEAVRAEGTRLVYTSSIATIGGMHDGVLPDEQCMPVGSPPGPYKQSKWEAEALVREEAQRGLDTVIVNPTFPVGVGDVRPTPTGCLIRDFLEGRMPAYVDTGMNVVDVDDVAEGELLAFDRGQRGERYILGHANLTMREFLEELATIAGRKPPRFRMPHFVALGLAHADALVTGRLLGRAPRIPLEGVRTAREIMFASPGRAVRELGLPQTPIREALAKAVHWFEERARGGRRGVS